MLPQTILPPWPQEQLEYSRCHQPRICYDTDVQVMSPRFQLFWGITYKWNCWDNYVYPFEKNTKRFFTAATYLAMHKGSNFSPSSSTPVIPVLFFS